MYNSAYIGDHTSVNFSILEYIDSLDYKISFSDIHPQLHSSSISYTANSFGNTLPVSQFHTKISFSKYHIHHLKLIASLLKTELIAQRCIQLRLLKSHVLGFYNASTLCKSVTLVHVLVNNEQFQIKTEF